MMIRTRLATLTAVAAVTALAVTGCGRSSGGTAESSAGELTDGEATGTVTIWAQGTEGEALQDFVEPFEEANPDVTVEVTAVPWGDALSKYQTAVAGGTTPDVGMLGTDWMPNFGAAMQTVPDNLDTSGMFPAALLNAEVDGTAVAVPWILDTRVLYYRTDLLPPEATAAFPTDWQGLRDLAAAYQQQAGAEYGISLPTSGFGTYMSLLPFLWSGGGDLTSADGSEWTLDSPANVEGMAFLESLFQEGIADPTPEADSAQARFVDGSTPMLVSGAWDIATINEAGGPGMADKYALAPIPAGPGGTSTSFVGGTNLGVFKTAENPDAAWKLVQWLTTPEVQEQWFQTVTALPSQQSAWDAPALAQDPKVSVFGEQLPSVKAPPTVTTWNQVSAEGDTAVEQMVTGVRTPQEAAAQIQAAAESLGMGS